MRLGAGIALIEFGLSSGFGDPVTVVRDLTAAAWGVLLLAGLWTPIIGALIAADELWIASSQNFSPRGGAWIHILLAVMSASVAMLGPGAWSVDARLFGRKRFDIGDRTRRR